MNMAGRRAFLAAIALMAPAFRASLHAQSFSVDDFLRLSSRLTGYDNLDRETGWNHPETPARALRAVEAIQRAVQA
jgi:hypothetical protein